MAFDSTQHAYRDLRDIVSERTDPIVAWVGAGLSAPAGLPSWGGLRSALVEELKSVSRHEPDPEQRSSLFYAATEADSLANFWNAFSILEDKLGATSFPAAIRRAMRKSDQAQVPDAYRYLWRIGCAGMINLNIDRFAKRAFSDAHPGKPLHDFTSSGLSTSLHLLKSPVHWIAQMHGELDNKDSWGFTSHALKRLFETTAYKTFVDSCLATKTVLFVGISADDVAAGGHLERLTKLGLDAGDHFWITHRTDAETRHWAENAGIRLINYDASNGHHELTELFDDLSSYVSFDSPAHPVRPTVMEGPLNAELPPPEELSMLPSAEIRDTLNQHACQLLSRDDAESIAAFEQFVEQYEDPIYRGWRVTDKPPNNTLLGYAITERCKDGAFGTVYRAEDKGGKQYAIKVLHERIRNDPEMLHSFRQGVSSMRILTSEAVDGVVRYYNGSEIPATVVMDFIEGVDLQEAVEKGIFSDWHSRLFVAKELTRIIRNSHRLPQRVLHRDIRPSNIMLENCWGRNPDWPDVKLYVLDFDLSWHVNAFDVSISQPGTANGYLAPEQAERSKGVSTRNAAVDSFGVGMTLYFAATGVEPRYGEHRYADWSESLDGCAANHPCTEWTSLPARFFRMVGEATRDRQEDRIDMAQIQDEIAQLSDALANPDSVRSAELLAEEIASRATANRYEWSASEATAKFSDATVNGILAPNEKEGKICLYFQWQKSGHDSHAKIKKWLPKASDIALSVLRAGGWKATSSYASHGLDLTATIRVADVCKIGLNDVSSHVKEASQVFQF